MEKKTGIFAKKINFVQFKSRLIFKIPNYSKHQNKMLQVL